MVRSGCSAVVFALALVLAACTGCGARMPAGASKYDSYASYVRHESSVRLLVQCADGTGGIGSGVAVSNDVVLTAKHMIEHCPSGIRRITAFSPDGSDHVMLVYQLPTDSGVDAASLISMEDEAPFKTFAKLADGMPKIGAQVCWTSGDVHLPLRGVTKCGIYEGRDAFYETWLVAGKAAPGNSGSGVFDASGELVGVLSVGVWEPSMDFVTGIVPISQIAELIPSQNSTDE